MNQVATHENKTTDIMEVAGKYLESMGNGLKEHHRNQFLEICKAYQLNPFKREVYGIQYGNNFNIIVGYEIYLKRAEMSGQLAGWKAWTEGSGSDMKGCVEIKRKDWEEPFYHEAYLDEYDQKNSMWKNKPRTMIKKVAISQAFRMAFPVELGGIPYTADELPEKDVTPQPQQVQKQAPQQPHYYPDAEFQKNLPKWQEAINNGKADAEKIITMVSTKGLLTDAQKQQIRDLEQPASAPAPTPEPEPETEVATSSWEEYSEDEAPF